MNNLRLNKSQIVEFQNVVLAKGEELYRDMPWRTDTHPYNILLSEIMLQQTQVSRVLQKYEEFKIAFPTLSDLAYADFQEVLSHWSGLGYNRRARFLHETAKKLMEYPFFPDSPEVLLQCPGIGENTAASIIVYAFNKPLVFLETNVRTVLIYTFFQGVTEKIEESVLRNLAEQTLYKENPRKWFWALMDYGTYLKKTQGNFNKYSKVHTIQSKFEGSFRQKRAALLRILLQNGPLTVMEIIEKTSYELPLVEELVSVLQKEKMIKFEHGRYCIA